MRKEKRIEKAFSSLKTKNRTEKCQDEHFQKVIHKFRQRKNEFKFK